MPIIHEEAPKFPHEFAKIQRADIMMTGGPSAKQHWTYTSCKHCGKQYLGPHDLFSECRERKRRDQMKGH